MVAGESLRQLLQANVSNRQICKHCVGVHSTDTGISVTSKKWNWLLQKKEIKFVALINVIK